MGAPKLLHELRNAGYSISADGDCIEITPADNLSSEIVKLLKQQKSEIIAALRVEQQQEFRREKVLAMLADDSDLSRAVYTDAESDLDNIIITIAVRHAATCEVLVPKANYDPWQLLSLVEKAGRSSLH